MNSFSLLLEPVLSQVAHPGNTHPYFLEVSQLYNQRDTFLRKLIPEEVKPKQKKKKKKASNGGLNLRPLNP